MSTNVKIEGNVGGTPKVTTFKSGKKVVQFSVAINQGRRNGQDLEPLWLEVEAWDENLTHALEKFSVGKGTRIAVQGYLASNNYETQKEGVKTKVRGVKIKMNYFKVVESSGNREAANSETVEQPTAMVAEAEAPPIDFVAKNARRAKK